MKRILAAVLIWTALAALPAAGDVPRTEQKRYISIFGPATHGLYDCAPDSGEGIGAVCFRLDGSESVVDLIRVREEPSGLTVDAAWYFAREDFSQMHSAPVFCGDAPQVPVPVPQGAHYLVVDLAGRISIGENCWTPPLKGIVTVAFS